MMNKLMGLVREEEGQGMAEYGLILAVVAVVALSAFKLLGTDIGKVLKSVTDSM